MSEQASASVCPVLGVEEAMAEYGIPVNRVTFYKAIAAGQIPSVRIGRRILIPRSYLDSTFGPVSTAVAPNEEVDGERIAAEQLRNQLLSAMRQDLATLARVLSEHTVALRSVQRGLADVRDRVETCTPGTPAGFESVHIADCGLTERAANVLRIGGIENLAELCLKTADDLLKMRGFGHYCLVDVRAMLTRYGAWLRNEGPTH